MFIGNTSYQIHILIFVLTFLIPEWTVSSTVNILMKTCTDVGTYSVIFGISIEKCGLECQLQKRCSMIMYHHGTNGCNLKYFVNWSSLTEKEPICAFASKSDWKRQDVGKCSNNTCRETDRCETAVSDLKGFKCITTECPRPHNISNAELLSNMHAVGYKNGYKCDRGYVGTGDPFLTCTNSGTWTSTTFTCNLRGRQLNTTFENGELTSVVGEKWIQGTVIHFQCRPGFQGQGATATSMINDQGNWEPSVVQCCNENSTEIWEDSSCVARYNGSALGSRTGMMHYCNESGGSMKWLSITSIDQVFNSGEYLWFMNNNRKPTFAKRYNLTLCLGENMNTTELAEFSNYTYDSLVQEVVTRNLTGQNCEMVSWWATGQPNGSTLELCIAFSHTDFKMHDVPCNLKFTGGEHVGFMCTYILPLI